MLQERLADKSVQLSVKHLAWDVKHSVCASYMGTIGSGNRGIFYDRQCHSTEVLV